MTFITQSVVEFARFQLDNDCSTMARLLYGLLEPEGRVAKEVHAIRKPGRSLLWGLRHFNRRMKRVRFK